jgi:hypothetical protein
VGSLEVQMNVPADGEGRRLLVATGAAAPDMSTLPVLVRGLVNAASEILVVSPILPGRLQWWVSDTDQARHQADLRLEAVLGQIEEETGAPVEGVVGDETSLTAFDDAVRNFRPDHILIALRGPQDAYWQERGLLDQVRQRCGVPLTVFVVA